MTAENCLRLAEHFEKLGRKEEAQMYRERAQRKIDKYPQYAYLRKAKDTSKSKTSKSE